MSVSLTNLQITVLGHYKFFRGICSCNDDDNIEGIMKKLCKGYFDLYEQQKVSKTLENAQKDEFFGLRDFYRYECVFVLYIFILKYIKTICTSTFCICWL